MQKVINCSCGYIVRAENDDKLVAKAQEHAKTTHATTREARRARMRMKTSCPWVRDRVAGHGKAVDRRDATPALRCCQGRRRLCVGSR